MKYYFLSILFLSITLTDLAQTICGPKSAVKKVVVIIDGMSNPPSTVQLNFKSRGIQAFYDKTYNFYAFELSPAEVVSVTDLSKPSISGYTSDDSHQTEFSVQSINGVCSAVFKFYYLQHYVLSVMTDPSSSPVTVNSTTQSNQPVQVNNLSPDSKVTITANCGSDWQYYFEFNVKDFATQLNSPIIQYEKDIKEYIKNNPKLNIGPQARNFIDKSPLKLHQIQYKLSLCSNCQ